MHLIPLFFFMEFHRSERGQLAVSVNVTLFVNGVSADSLGKMKPLKWVLILQDCVLIKGGGEFGHRDRHTYREGDLKTQENTLYKSRMAYAARN